MTDTPDKDKEHGEQFAPEVLVEVQDDFEAGAVITALRERGVEASAVGGFTAGFIAEAPGYVQVVVRKLDLPAARAALKDIRLHHETIDWSKIDVGEPEDDTDSTDEQKGK